MRSSVGSLLALPTCFSWTEHLVLVAWRPPRDARLEDEDGFPLGTRELLQHVGIVE